MTLPNIPIFKITHSTASQILYFISVCLNFSPLCWFLHFQHVVLMFNLGFAPRTQVKLSTLHALISDSINRRTPTPSAPRRMHHFSVLGQLGAAVSFESLFDLPHYDGHQVSQELTHPHLHPLPKLLPVGHFH